MRQGENNLRSGDNWLSGEDWDAQWESFRRSAFRLETLSVYKVGAEEGELEKFLATGTITSDRSGWLDELRAHRAAGRTVGRVHAIMPPLTDYLRYEFACYEENVAAGEEVRILDLSRTADPGLPNQDFWLFDDETVVLMHYQEDGTQIGRERLSGIDASMYTRYKELAMQHSVPFREYQDSLKE